MTAKYHGHPRPTWKNGGGEHKCCLNVTHEGKCVCKCGERRPKA